MEYEVVIPAAAKDYNKIPYLVSSIKYLNPQPEKINIIHSGGIDVTTKLDFPAISYINQRLVFDVYPNAASGFNRPPWIYQQFLKLFQDVTDTRMYLVMDSDLVLNKPLDLFNNAGDPYFFLGVDQNHAPYFEYSQDMFGFGRLYNHSFISEIMMFDKGIIDGLLSTFYYHQIKIHGVSFNFTSDEYYSKRNLLIKELYQLTADGACDDWIPADYEIYGNYVEQFDASLYEKKHIKTNLRGKYKEWTQEELESYILEMKELNEHDMFTAHTWV